MREIVSLLLVVIAVSSFAADDKYYQYVDSADRYMAKKEWRKAENMLKQILVAYPDDNNNSLILSNLATVQRYQGKYSEAINNYSYAINMTPNAVTLLKNRAMLYYGLDSLRRALDDYARVIQIDEKEEESRYYHGYISMQLKDMATAKKDFDYILFYNPASALGHEGLGYWHMKNGNYIEAVKYYSKIIEQRPTSILLSNRAQCYLQLKKLTEAAQDINQAIEIDPADGFLYVLRAKVHKARFSTEEMEKDIQMAEKYGISRSASESYLRIKR